VSSTYLRSKQEVIVVVTWISAKVLLSEAMSRLMSTTVTSTWLLTCDQLRAQGKKTQPLNTPYAYFDVNYGQYTYELDKLWGLNIQLTAPLVTRNCKI
jgi:hypothetical protein